MPRKKVIKEKNLLSATEEAAAPTQEEIDVSSLCI